ncbi:hypothetical protein R6Q59_002877 [Mikania micrantha]
MEQSGSGNPSVPETSAHTVESALQFDLNKTPPPSPPEEILGGNDDGAPADHRCALCRRTHGEMVVCCVCVKHFHVECLNWSEEESDWKCAECSTECRRRKRLRRSASAVSGGGTLRRFDINASPTREVDGDDVGVYVNTEFALTDSAHKMQDKCGIPLVECTLTSTNSRPDMQIAQLNLDTATQNANLVYLQALKDYISEKRGVLGEGWHVKFKYSQSICRNFPIYCAPDGRKFDSMQKVAHYVGLLSASNFIETNDYDSSTGVLQNGSQTAKNINYSSRSMSRVSNSRNAVEVDPMENDNCVSDLFHDGFPVQFEDFFITSIGKIDPQFSFHSASQIWPVGYKSIWHDKLTGSIFVCNVLENGDYGPKFRVNRYPCTKLSIPNASTLICKPKGGPSGQSSCSTTASQHMTSNNFVNGDLIGEFSVEGRSPSSAWQMVLETLLLACRQSFQDIKYLSFFCNHGVESEHFYGSYGVDSLDKFRYLTGHTNSIPSLILTVDQLDFSCMVLRRWLQPDRFGLDAEFVQELIEQLLKVSTCSGFKYLDARCQNSASHTVGSGFFTILKKYHSQPKVSDTLTENEKRLGPPGNAIASNIPPDLVGNFLQAYEFFLRFHGVLGQEKPLSRQKLEYELLNPWVDGLNSTIYFDTKAPNGNFTEGTKDSEYHCQSQLSNFHIAMVKMLVEDMLSKIVVNDPFNAMELKLKKARKKNVELNVNFYGQKSKVGIFPVNEVTWPELARRYILAFLSLDDKFEDLEITSREFNEIFHCLNGNGGPLCGSLTGMAANEADAVVLAEASKKVFSSVKSKIADIVIDKEDLNVSNFALEKKRTDNKCPGWIKVLEPIRKLATNVGAKIRDRVKKSLEKGPPEWATEMLLKSISKDVYKGNAAGPTKKIVVEVLEKVRNENPLTKKKAKESRSIRTISDVIMKQCRMVLRAVAAQDENKFFFNLLSESFLKLNDFDDIGNLEVSRPLDFRTIDLRLDAGSYGDSHESFIEDVREVLQNLRIKFRSQLKYLECIEKISKKIEELYEQEILTLVKYENGATSSSGETKKELNMMIAKTISTALYVAPWEVGICKICGKDENDHILLLCDRCDAEYHTYCLNPPLQRIPKSSWYCPPCILFITNQGQYMSREQDFDFMGLRQPTEKKKRQREFTRNGMEALADLADNMESMEYWELGVKERVSLLHFLCDEALGLTIIREQLNTDNCVTKRNFLGRDSAGRLYWALGGPERLFVSGPYSEGEVSVASDSSSKEFDSWICYESDAEMETLVDWLRDDNARERELKETIINWRQNKSNNCNGQVDFNIDCIKTSVYGTNARAELEKKFGLFGEGRIAHDGKTYRCDCLELVGSTRHHCFSCHLTFFNNEVHQCNSSEKQLRLTNGLVWSNGNPSFFMPEYHLHNTKTTFSEQGVNLNEVDESNPECITGKRPVSFGPTRNLSFIPMAQIHGSTAFLVKQGVNLNESPSEFACSNLEDVTGKALSSSSGPIMDRVSEIIRLLKIILLDIETALPREAFRPSRVNSDKLRVWREFMKSAQSIFEMVQATIIFEDMIKTEHLKKEWWYWSSPSAAAKISTVQSLALQIYALDAAIFYEKPPMPPPPPPVDLTNMFTVEDCKLKEETSKKSNLKKKLKSCSSAMTSNDLEALEILKSEDKPTKKKPKVSDD